MATAAKARLLTFDDFCRMVPDGQKADLIDGVIYMASPDNTDANDLFVWLLRLIADFVDLSDLGKVFGSRVAFRLSDFTSPEPDIGFVRKRRLSRVRRGFVDGPPDLALEIVSPDSVERDYEKKRAKYEEQGILEYWIVDELKKGSPPAAPGPLRQVPRSAAAPGPPAQPRAEGVLAPARVGVAEAAAKEGERVGGDSGMIEFYGNDSVYSESGVDLTLLRESLSQPVEARIESNSKALPFLAALQASAGNRRPQVSGVRAVLDVPEILRQFQEHQVDYVLIGGLAMIAHGSNYQTKDVDFCYARAPRNLAALVAALESFHPYQRGVPPGLPFRFDVPTLQAGFEFYFEHGFRRNRLAWRSQWHRYF